MTAMTMWRTLTRVLHAIETTVAGPLRSDSSSYLVDRAEPLLLEAV